MKHLGKLSVLGAVLAASAPFASALTFSGNIATAGDGTFVCGSTTNPTSCTFTQTGNGLTPPDNIVQSSTLALRAFDPGASGGTSVVSFGNFTANSATNIATFFNPLVSIFATNAVISALSGGVFTSDTLLFNGTGMVAGTLIPVGVPSGGGFFSPSGSVILNGMLSDSDGLFTTATGFLAFSENGGEVNFTDNELAVTPPATPEPSSLILLGSGFVSAAGMLIRRRRTA